MTIWLVIDSNHSDGIKAFTAQEDAVDCMKALVYDCMPESEAENEIKEVIENGRGCVYRIQGVPLDQAQDDWLKFF